MRRACPSRDWLSECQARALPAILVSNLEVMVMREFRIKSVRSTTLDRTLSSRRRTVRSVPRLETLEDRVVMSTFQVNTTLDTVSVDLRTGRDATGHISLRSAIMAADAKGGSNTIKLP